MRHSKSARRGAPLEGKPADSEVVDAAPARTKSTILRQRAVHAARRASSSSAAGVQQQQQREATRPGGERVGAAMMRTRADGGVCARGYKNSCRPQN
ncbi:hypothetical protein EON68_02330, partial [archaeon]